MTQTHPNLQGDSALAWTLVVILSVLLVGAIGLVTYLLNEQPIESENIDNIADTSLLNIPSSENSLKVSKVSPTPSIKQIEKTYTFSTSKEESQLQGNLDLTIENVERTKQIQIAGGVAKAMQGRELVILNIDLTNNFDQRITVKARDYFRLRIGEKEKWYGPDYHSDPVEIQAKTSKQTRIGFNIEEGNQALSIQIRDGEEIKDTLSLYELE